MADTFFREPINGGDFNNYHDFVMRQLRCGGRGGLSMELYDNGGSLYLSAGYAGIDDGVTKGTIERTAAGALSIAGVSAGGWGKVEASVSGTSVTFAVSDETPANVIAAYDYMKAGYYLTPDKRVIGYFFKTAGGALGHIVNCESGKSGFKKCGGAIGDTMMFDGTGWVDNATKPGWYACIAANASVGCPNLVDRFIMGKVVAGAGATGGSNTHQIAAAELPPHTHLVYTDYSAGALSCVKAATIAGSVTYAIPTGDGGFANTAIDTKPAYYSVIFIRKCA